MAKPKYKNIKERLDEELEMAEEMLGKIKDITLYKDAYEELCEALGQPEVNIYKGIKVLHVEQMSPELESEFET